MNRDEILKKSKEDNGYGHSDEKDRDLMYKSFYISFLTVTFYLLAYGCYLSFINSIHFYMVWAIICISYLPGTIYKIIKDNSTTNTIINILSAVLLTILSGYFLASFFLNESPVLYILEHLHIG